MLPSLLSGELPAVLQFLALSERDNSASLGMWHVHTLQDHHRVIGASLRPPSHWRRSCGRLRTALLRVIDTGLQSVNVEISSAWRKASDRTLWRRIIDTATLHRGAHHWRRKRRRRRRTYLDPAANNCKGIWAYRLSLANRVRFESERTGTPFLFFFWSPERRSGPFRHIAATFRFHLNESDKFAVFGSKMPSASGGLRPTDQGLCPWTPLGAPPPDPIIGSRSRARHILSVPVLFLTGNEPWCLRTILVTKFVTWPFDPSSSRMPLSSLKDKRLFWNRPSEF